MSAAEVLLKLVATLGEARIPYMAIGEWAMQRYGVSSRKSEIELTLGIGPDNLDCVLRIIAQMEFRLLVDDPLSFAEESLLLPVIDDRSEMRFDLIFSLPGYERTAIARGIAVEIGGASIVCASAEDLVIHKLIAGQPEDLADIRVIALRERNLDAAYIEGHLAVFEEALGEKYRAVYREICRR